MDKASQRQIIFDTIDDLVSRFLYYDRKDDEELRIGDIEKVINRGYVSVDEIAERFKNKFIEGIG